MKEREGGGRRAEVEYGAGSLVLEGRGLFPLLFFILQFLFCFCLTKKKERGGDMHGIFDFSIFFFFTIYFFLSCSSSSFFSHPLSTSYTPSPTSSPPPPLPSHARACIYAHIHTYTHTYSAHASLVAIIIIIIIIKNRPDKKKGKGKGGGGGESAPVLFFLKFLSIILPLSTLS